MDYGRLPFRSIQAAYDRLALLEWFFRNGEATDAEIGEIVRLRALVEPDFCERVGIASPVSQITCVPLDKKPAKRF